MKKADSLSLVDLILVDFSCLWLVNVPAEPEEKIKLVKFLDHLRKINFFFLKINFFLLSMVSVGSKNLRENQFCWSKCKLCTNLCQHVSAKLCLCCTPRFVKIFFHARKRKKCQIWGKIKNLRAAIFLYRCWKPYSVLTQGVPINTGISYFIFDNW